MSAVTELAKEGVKSALINGALGGLIAYGRFHSYSLIPVWGARGIMVDSLPATAVPAFLMTTGLTFLARRDRRIYPVALSTDRLLPRLPSNVLSRALALSVTAVAITCPLSLLLLIHLGRGHFSLIACLFLKVAQAALVGALLAPVILLRAALDTPLGSDRPKP